MASRVNTKFVALLVTALVLVGGGVAATAFFILFKSASQLHSLAQEKLKTGDLVNADKFMSKAVAKERTNSGYMREWIEIMKKLELKSQTEFENKYRTNFVPAQRQLAVLLRNDVQAHKDYLDQVWDQMSSGGLSRKAADEMVKQTNDALRFFDKQPPGPWETLKRYRGMAMTRVMLDQAEMKDEERALALADLEAAYKADPKDAEVAVAIENWHFADSIWLRGKGQDDEAKASAAAGREVVENYLAANPGEPKLMLVKLRWLLNDAQRAVGDALTNEAKKSAFKRANEQAVPKLDELTAIIKSAPLEKAGLDVVSMLKSYETMLDPGATSRRALEVLEAQSAAHPDDADLLYALGRTYQDRNEFEKAIAAYDKMIAIPQKTLGIAGLRQFTLRAEGAFRQTLAAVALFDRVDAAEKDKKAAMLAKAKEYRANLVKFEPEDSARGRLATAQVKFREGDVSGAQALMVAYETANKEPDAEALWLSAQIALALNQPGIAKQKLTALLQVNGNDAKAVFLLASVEARLQNFETAERYAQGLLEADPTNELSKRLLDEIRMQRGDTNVGDDVAKVLNEAQKLSEAGKMPEVFKLLEGAFAKKPGDVRLAYALVMQQYRAKNQTAAVKTAETALAADPNNPQLKQLLIIARNPDPVEGTIQAVDASDLSPLDKILSKIDIYRQNPQPTDEKIRALIAEATKLAPDEPRVVEYRFISAVTSQNFDEGRKITETAATKNLDSIGGASFRARLMDAESDALRKQGKTTEADAKLADAITALQQASGQPGFGLEAWRMLGNLQFRGQRFTDAINSYKRGLAIRPNDVPLIEEYVAALVNVPGETMMDEALQFARDSEKYARGSSKFRNMLLNLEARSGDAAKAISERTKMLVMSPDNRDNKVALAALYIDQKDFAKARPIIDAVRADKDDLEAVQLDARYYSSIGDSQGSEKVLREFAAKLDPAKNEADRATKSQALLSLMRASLSSGNVEKAEAIIAEVRAFQDPKTLPADRTLGDMYMSMERFEKAIEPLARVVDGKADDADYTYSKRLVEACIRAGKPDEAQARIKAMGAYGETSPIVQLLISDSLQATAQAARAKGDEAKAKSLDGQALSVLDKAVTTFPASAEVYMKRALFTMERKGAINDALADANKSLQIRPGYPQALRLRAQIKAKAGLEDDAIKDLREALRTDIFADELRAQLMTRLIGDNRNAEAGELATEALLRRQNDVQLMLSFATLFANRGDTQRAEPFVDMAVKRSDQTFVALQALDFYLSVMPVGDAPSLDKAEKILERQKDKIASDPALLLARSQVLGRRGKNLESRRDAAASIKMIDDKERTKLLNWFGQLRRVMKPADLTLLFDGLELEKVKVEWIRFFRSQQMMLTKDQEKQGLEILEQLMKAKDDGVRLQALRTVAPFFYTKGEYQKAADAWLLGLKEFPKDWEMRNNLAFTFAKFLGKPAEGAEQSKEAAKILEEAGQTNADVYDTLGYCLTQLGKYAEAKVAFEKAINQATNLVTAATIKTHETEMHVKAGSLDDAKRSYQQAYEFIGKIKPPEAGPEQVKQLRDDLDQFKAGAGL